MYNYKNPFAEYNSNIMSSELIAELFAEPFELFNIDPNAIKSEKSSIIFIGGRGTGKTMLLRQFSYNVQRIPDMSKPFIEKLKEEKYLGIYFRVDNPLLRSLDSFAIFNKDDKFSESVFTHYFELTIFKEYLEVIKIILKDLNIKKGDKTYKKIITELSGLVSCEEIDDIDSLLEYVIEQINYIWFYQSQKAIDIDGNIHFTPKCGMILYGRLTNEFCKCEFLDVLGINDISILLLIDEFENFSKAQQKVLNTAMRFTKDYGTCLRIGMRPNGFKTYDTLSEEDYIKEGRDYRKAEFGNPLVFKKNNDLYPNLIKKIAAKRLALVPMFRGKDITDFLGEEENLEVEAKDIVKGGTKHIETYLKEINKVRTYKGQPKLNMEYISSLRNENPLYEMENLRLLLKGEGVEYVIKAFNDYKNHIVSPEGKKYSNDYDNKYKLTFVFVLSSIYRKEKKGYYSFNDYCQLSSGIIGNFLELCRRAFDLAYFKDYEALIEGRISNEVQTDAAYEFSYSERDMIQRIAKYGGALQVFIDNIGNAFSHIHKDLYMRYPETNQFPIGKLSPENMKLFELACMWSLIIKKKSPQNTNGKDTKEDVYILNRILAPFFKISYRTRGGLNPIEVTDEYFKKDFKPENIISPVSQRVRNMVKHKENKQPTLLDLLDDQD